MASASRSSFGGSCDSESRHRLRSVACNCRWFSSRTNQCVAGRTLRSTSQFEFSKCDRTGVLGELLQERQWGLCSSTLEQSKRGHGAVPGRDLQLLEARFRNMLPSRGRFALDPPPVAKTHALSGG